VASSRTRAARVTAVLGHPGTAVATGGTLAVLLRGRPELVPAVLGAVLLGVALARIIRARRNAYWRARTARWDRPEVWVVLDAVRDREQKRARFRADFDTLNAQLAATLAGLAAGFEGIALDARTTVARLTRNFDARGRGFGDQVIHDRAGLDNPEEVPDL
jgi:hypothetical protein